MRCAPCCGLLLVAALSGWSATPVTVLLEYDQPSSPATQRALESELASILSVSHIKVDLRLRKDVPDGSEFAGLVLFRMKGSCSLQAVPVGALSDERGPLAWTHSTNGELLPFGEVECNRVRQSLSKSFGTTNLAAHEAQYGVALARVMAHELYHMMAGSPLHTKDGLTKPALTPQELTSGKLALPRQARERLSH